GVGSGGSPPGADSLASAGRRWDAAWREATSADEGHGLDRPLDQIYVGAAVLDFMKDYLVPKR
ncbi:MAG: hypothetical protein ACRENQ_05415, partial [Gemmatimonadaceae bacterium]